MKIIRESNELKKDEMGILGKFKTLPPESFVVLLILIAVFLNIALHRRGLVKHTMTTIPESISNDRGLKREYLKKTIPSELKTVFPALILRMNNIINDIGQTRRPNVLLCLPLSCIIVYLSTGKTNYVKSF